jgi:hypothetical protein
MNIAVGTFVYVNGGGSWWINLVAAALISGIAYITFKSESRVKEIKSIIANYEKNHEMSENNK